MKIFGNKYLFYALSGLNTLLFVSGLCILIIGLYECVNSSEGYWYNTSFAIFGGFMMVVAIYGFFTYSKAELISLYLSAVAIVGSFHISFSLGILLENGPGSIDMGSKLGPIILLSLVGAIVISCFTIGLIYRNTLHYKPTLNDRSISLQGGSFINY